MCQSIEVWMSGLDFGLDHSFRYASDLECRIEKLKSGASLQCWNSFFDCMFPSWSSSVSIKRKCDVIFRIIFILIHNEQKEIINLTRPNRVPVPKNINCSSIILGAMDSFNCEENTLPGIGGSQDTIWYCFKNLTWLKSKKKLVRSLRTSASCWQTKGV